MPTFSLPGTAGSIHVVDLREESPTPSDALPIVFVHGMVAYTGVWNASLASCADKRRAIAIDLRGHGNSEAPSDGDYSVDACASDILAVLDLLALGPIVLVGHSYGTFVSIDVAARRPDLVRRLVLVDPPGDFTTLPADIRETQLDPYVAMLNGDGWQKAAAASFEDALKGGTEETAAIIRARLAAMPRDAIVGMSHSMFRYPASATLKRYLAAPDTSAHTILAPANAWPFSLHTIVPSLTSSVVSDVGHWIMLDAPERFVAALQSVVRAG